MDEEVEMARAAGWQVIGLGPRILRADTAALVLVAWAGLMAPEARVIRGSCCDINPRSARVTRSVPFKVLARVVARNWAQA